METWLWLNSAGTKKTTDWACLIIPTIQFRGHLTTSHYFVPDQLSSRPNHQPKKFPPYGCWFLVDESFQNDLDNSALGIYTNFPKLYGWVWFRGSTKSHSKSWSSEIPQLQVTSEEPVYIRFTKMKNPWQRRFFLILEAIMASASSYSN